LLTGKVRRGQPVPSGSRLETREGYVTEAKLDKVESLIAWGEDRGVSLLQIAIGALAALPGCGSVIAGATKPEQVRSNVAAADWEPTASELEELNKIVPPPAAS
jgi:aryl-alcohol dehydrogenase-like predicted oxidoreductase